MIVTVFRSRLMPGLQDEYVALVEEVRKEVETMPGYISHKGFFAEDGERVTIVEFKDEEGAARLADERQAYRGAAARPAEVLRGLRHPGLQRAARHPFQAGRQE